MRALITRLNRSMIKTALTALIVMALCIGSGPVLAGSHHARSTHRRQMYHTHSRPTSHHHRSSWLWARHSESVKHDAHRSHRSTYATGARRNHHGRIARSARERHAFMRSHPCPSTGKTSGACPGYVVDHIRALKHGGADDPKNMQWQTTAAAKAKDRWE